MISILRNKQTQVENVVLLSHKSSDSHIPVKVEFGNSEGKVPMDEISKRAEKYKPAPKVIY
jgi:site-specific DNA recombinase